MDKLTEEQQLALFEPPNSFELVKAYIENHHLLVKAQIKMLEHPRNAELLRLYVQKDSLYFYNGVEEALFAQPNSYELWQIYTEKHQLLSFDGVRLMCQHPNACEMAKSYIQKYNVDTNHLRYLFALPNKDELLEIYVSKGYHINRTWQTMIFYHPKAEELLTKYLQHNRQLGPEAFIRLAKERNSGENIFYNLLYWKIDPYAPTGYSAPDNLGYYRTAEEVIKTYVEHYGDTPLGQKVAQKMSEFHLGIDKLGIHELEYEEILEISTCYKELKK